MPRETEKYLFDIERAATLALEFTSGRSFADYQGDAMLRAAVERQFEIAGEALSKLARIDPTIASRIRDHRQIIAFRNILIHGYAEVDDALVWEIVEHKLPLLHEDVRRLLHSPDAT